MTTYTYSQLEGLWEQAGGPAALAPIMAAIAEAESGGNSQAYNASGASGLWQILGAVNPSDQGNLFNPQVNAKEALLKYKTQGLGAWVTYTSGAYKQYLQGNVPPASLVGGGPPPGVAAPGSPGSPASGGGTVPPGTPAPPSSSDLTGLLAPVRNLLHAVATVIDYSFSMFEPGQGFRVLFGAGAAILAFLSYKVLARPGGAVI